MQQIFFPIYFLQIIRSLPLSIFHTLKHLCFFSIVDPPVCLDNQWKSIETYWNSSKLLSSLLHTKFRRNISKETCITAQSLMRDINFVTKLIEMKRYSDKNVLVQSHEFKIFDSNFQDVDSSKAIRRNDSNRFFF